MSLEFDKLPPHIQEHIKCVLESLYKFDGADENPMCPDDSPLGVAMRLSQGLHKLGKPEFTPLESKLIEWAYARNFNMPNKWPPTAVMLKEIVVYSGPGISEEQIAVILDIQEWEVKPRMSTPEGIKVCWVGAVIKTLAVEYWVVSQEDKGESPGFNII